MFHHATPYIIPGEQMTAAKILAGAITDNPGDFCVSDYSLFTTMFWHAEFGSEAARSHFYEKLQEELGEADEELEKQPIDVAKAIEEYGDASFCVFALGNACKLDPTMFIKDLWARQGIDGIQCRGDTNGPPYVESVAQTEAVRRYKAASYGFAMLHQPYVYDFKPGENYLDQRNYQVRLIGQALSRLNQASQLLIGYTLADIWLGETKRVSEALGEERVMILGMADNMLKMLARVEASQT